jgi:phosphatidylglycerophosphatase C
VRCCASRPGTLTAAVRRDRDRLKELLVGGVLRGRKVAQIEAMGEEFAEQVEASWLRADTVERLRWHQRAGHRIVLVSASLRAVPAPARPSPRRRRRAVCRAVRAGDEFADGLDGANCRAAEKVRRLDAWLSARRLENATVWAYGDSNGDRELLARADHPFLVKDTLVSAVPVGFE